MSLQLNIFTTKSHTTRNPCNEMSRNEMSLSPNVTSRDVCHEVSHNKVAYNDLPWNPAAQKEVGLYPARIDLSADLVGIVCLHLLIACTVLLNEPGTGQPLPVYLYQLIQQKIDVCKAFLMVYPFEKY